MKTTELTTVGQRVHALKATPVDQGSKEVMGPFQSSKKQQEEKEWKVELREGVY